ncbi:MAG: hypothetical protein JNN01_16640 [Opitutaceae bacterium]|nr:hypothetical protein [Opitutaceae bacterium]
MKPSDDTPAAVRALLDALRRQRGARPEPDEDTLRRWLDGTLPPERAAELDLLLADHRDLRVALATARLRLTDPVPSEELARLESLVPIDAGGTVVAFPPAAASPERRRLVIAAAIAALLLAPAWTLGTRLAQTQAAAEQRELRQLLRQDLYRGGF